MFPWHSLHSPGTRTCTPIAAWACSHCSTLEALQGLSTAITRKSCSRDSQSPQLQKEHLPRWVKGRTHLLQVLLLVVLHSFSTQSNTPTLIHLFLKGS